jgi:hypothetical protein
MNRGARLSEKKKQMKEFKGTERSGLALPCCPRCARTRIDAELRWRPAKFFLINFVIYFKPQIGSKSYQATSENLTK